MQLLETSYTETVYDFKQMFEREKDSKRKIVNEKASEVAQHNELESLFVGCVEDVRKDIMKRRLKNEVYNKKKFQKMENHSAEAKEFENSLLRLA